METGKEIEKEKEKEKDNKDNKFSSTLSYFERVNKFIISNNFFI